MSRTKLIVVIGATGNQGGSVVETFLQDPNWRVRAITRNSSSTKAQSLKSKGAEVAQADLEDPSTLPKALEDANVIFAASDFWAFYNPANQDKLRPGQALNEWCKEQETQLLKNAIDAAAKVETLEKFILSSMPNVAKLSGGKYVNVCHFDSKADAEEYEKQTYPDLWAKTSVFKPGFFLSNFSTDIFGKLKQEQDGTVVFRSLANIDTKFPWIDHQVDTGPFVKSLIGEPEGKNVIAYRGWLSTRELADMFAKVTGYITKANSVDGEELLSICPPDLYQEFIEHFRWADEFGYEGSNDPTLIHPDKLDSPPELGTISEWFKAQDWPAVFAS